MSDKEGAKFLDFPIRTSTEAERRAALMKAKRILIHGGYAFYQLPNGDVYIVENKADK